MKELTNYAREWYDEIETDNHMTRWEKKKLAIALLFKSPNLHHYTGKEIEQHTIRTIRGFTK